MTIQRTYRTTVQPAAAVARRGGPALSAQKGNDMNCNRTFQNRTSRIAAGSLAAAAAMLCASSAWSLTATQIGPSGKSYASAGVVCGLDPVAGMSPMIQAGLYNPKKGASATVLLNGAPIANVTFAAPDATVTLPNGLDTVSVVLSKRVADDYAFDALPVGNQANVCVPDTSANTVSADLEYAASQKSYATVTPGCALNGATGMAQPFVNLFDNGTWLLNVSVNNAPLTQLNGVTRRSTPVFLAPGLNVIAAVNGSLSTDYYVRDGGTGTCTL